MQTGETSIPRQADSRRGFTLIELVVVMAIIGLLLSLALPRYLSTIDRGKESVQRQNIAAIRDAIDKFAGDQGRYPESLQELVEQRYLREVPKDPMTERPDWTVVPPADISQGGVFDVQSAYQGPGEGRQED